MLIVLVYGMLVKRVFRSNDTNLNPSSNNFLSILLISETTSKVHP